MLAPTFALLGFLGLAHAATCPTGGRSTSFTEKFAKPSPHFTFEVRRRRASTTLTLSGGLARPDPVLQDQRHDHDGPAAIAAAALKHGRSPARATMSSGRASSSGRRPSRSRST